MTMSAVPNYLWHETAQGEYRRHVFGYERHFAEVSRWDNAVPMLTPVTLSTPMPFERIQRLVRQAWISLRRETPSIGMKWGVQQLEDGSHLDEWIYQIPKSQAEIALWVEKTIHIESSGTSDDLVQTAFAERARFAAGAQDHLTHLYLSRDSERDRTFHLMLAGPHALYDSRGQLLLLHSLLSRLFQPELQEKTQNGSEIPFLPQSLLHQVGLREHEDAPRDLKAILDKMAAEETARAPFATLPHVSHVKLLGEAPCPRSGGLIVPSDQFESIRKMVKRNGTTLSALLGALIALLALPKALPPSRSFKPTRDVVGISTMFEVLRSSLAASSIPSSHDVKSLRLFSVPTDQRWRLPPDAPPYYGCAIHCGDIYISDITAARSAQKALLQESNVGPDLWKVCKEVKEGLEGIKHDDEAIAAYHDLIPLCFGALAKSPEAFLPAVPLFSSFGRLDDFVQGTYGDGEDSICIDAILPTTLTHNAPFFNVTAHSWKGELFIMTQHSRVSYTDEHALTFQEDLITIMMKLVEACKEPEHEVAVFLVNPEY